MADDDFLDWLDEPAPGAAESSQAERPAADGDGAADLEALLGDGGDQGTISAADNSGTGQHGEEIGDAGAEGGAVEAEVPSSASAPAPAPPAETRADAGTEHPDTESGANGSGSGDAEAGREEEAARQGRLAQEEEDAAFAADLAAALAESEQYSQVEAARSRAREMPPPVPSLSLGPVSTVLRDHQRAARRLVALWRSSAAESTPADASIVSSLASRCVLGIPRQARAWTWRTMLGLVPDAAAGHAFRDCPLDLPNQEQCAADARAVVARVEGTAPAALSAEAVEQAATHLVRSRGIPYARGAAHVLVPFLAVGLDLDTAHAATHRLMAAAPPRLWPSWQHCRATPRLAHLQRLLLTFHDPMLAHALADKHTLWFAPSPPDDGPTAGEGGDAAPAPADGPACGLVDPAAWFGCGASLLPLSQLLPVWDQLLSRRDASWPLCVSTALLVASRHALARCTDTPSLQGAIRAAFAGGQGEWHPGRAEMQAARLGEEGEDDGEAPGAACPPYSVALRAWALLKLTPTSFARDCAWAMGAAVRASPAVMRARLSRYYRRHNPANEGSVPDLLAQYRDREEEVEAGAKTRYGATLRLVELDSPEEAHEAGLVAAPAGQGGGGGDPDSPRTAGWRGCVSTFHQAPALTADELVPPDLQRALCMRVDAKDTVPLLCLASGSAPGAAALDEYGDQENGDGRNEEGEEEGEEGENGNEWPAEPPQVSDSDSSSSSGGGAVLSGDDAASPQAEAPVDRPARKPRPPVFLVDCRGEEETSCGRFPTAWPFDPALAGSMASTGQLVDCVRPLQGAVRVCFMHGLPPPQAAPGTETAGSGDARATAAALAAPLAALARRIGAAPRRGADGVTRHASRALLISVSQLIAAADLLAMLFTREGIPLVCLHRGGFLSALRFLHRHHLLHALADYDPAQCRTTMALRFETLKARNPKRYATVVAAARRAREQAEEEQRAAWAQQRAAEGGGAGAEQGATRVVRGVRQLLSTGGAALRTVAERPARGAAEASGRAAAPAPAATRSGPAAGRDAGLAGPATQTARRASRWLSSGLTSLAARAQAQTGQAAGSTGAPAPAPAREAAKRRGSASMVQGPVFSLVDDEDEGEGGRGGEDEEFLFDLGAGDGPSAGPAPAEGEDDAALLLGGDAADDGSYNAAESGHVGFDLASLVAQSETLLECDEGAPAAKEEGDEVLFDASQFQPRDRPSEAGWDQEGSGEDASTPDETQPPAPAQESRSAEDEIDELFAT